MISNNKQVIICLILLLFASLYCCAQVPVHDKNTVYQAEREVFIRWDNFKPKWYFWLFHNKYRNADDKRNFIQLYATMLVVKQTQFKTANQKENTDKVASYDIAKQANIEAETHYHLHFKPIFDELDKRYNTLISTSISLNVSLNDMQNFVDEKLMLENYIEAVRNGNVEKGESHDAMRQIQKDYEKLIAVINKTNSLYKVKNKFTEIVIEK